MILMLKEAQSRAVFPLHLLHGAGARGFFGTPVEQSCAVTEPAAGEMVELNFGDEFVVQRLPFQRMFGAPTAQPAGGFAGEAGSLDHLFEVFGQSREILVLG